MTVGLKLRDNQEKIMIVILIKIMIIQITLLINIRTSNTLSEKLSKINNKIKTKSSGYTKINLITMDF